MIRYAWICLLGGIGCSKSTGDWWDVPTDTGGEDITADGEPGEDDEDGEDGEDGEDDDEVPASSVLWGELELSGSTIDWAVIGYAAGDGTQWLCEGEAELADLQSETDCASCEVAFSGTVGQWENFQDAGGCENNPLTTGSTLRLGFGAGVAYRNTGSGWEAAGVSETEGSLILFELEQP